MNSVGAAQAAPPVLNFPTGWVVQAVGFHIQNGAILSRARVLYFKHNDVADLEAVLEKVAAEHARGGWAPCVLPLDCLSAHM